MCLRFVRFVLGAMLLLAIAVSVSLASVQPPRERDKETVPEPHRESMSAPPEKEVTAAELPTRLLDPGIELRELRIRIVPLTRSEMAALAREWQAMVKSKSVELADLQIALGTSKGDAEEKLRERLLELAEERAGLIDKYDAVLNGWEQKGGAGGTIQQFRSYREALLAGGAREADFKTIARSMLKWMTSPEGGIALALKIGLAILAVSAVVLAAGILRNYVKNRVGTAAQMSILLQTFSATVVYWLMISFGLMFVLASFGIDVTPLFALFGGGSFILGFALQDTLSNLANGLMIMINRPFDKGDIVDIAGKQGMVEAVNVSTTTISTPDNQLIVLPNKQVWGNTITNVTARQLRRVDLVFGIDYDDDIGKAIRILKEAISAHPRTLDSPEPTIVVGELAESSVNLLCRPWVKIADYWPVYWDLIRDVKNRFDAAGITIPYPQRKVHLSGSGQN